MPNLSLDHILLFTSVDLGDETHAAGFSTAIQLPINERRCAPCAQDMPGPHHTDDVAILVPFHSMYAYLTFLVSIFFDLFGQFAPLCNNLIKGLFQFLWQVHVDGVINNLLQKSTCCTTHYLSFAAHRPGVKIITEGNYRRPDGANLGIAKNGVFSVIGRCCIGLHVIRVWIYSSLSVRGLSFKLPFIGASSIAIAICGDVSEQRGT